MEQVSNTKRIAKNTLMLYFRQILILLVSLYTVRVVLNTLGAQDYGIYNVVAGVVTMFSFLSGAMATASQRYFAFDMGKGDDEHLKITFSITLQIYILLAFVIILLAETIGLWVVNCKLVIPQERMTAANWIYQAAIVSFLFTLITTPYMACIIAHEDMNIYALVSIVEAVLKLVIVFLLRVLTFDKLIIYGFLLASVAVITTSIYREFCHRHYKESKFHFVRDKVLFKEIVSYSGWNLFGSSVGIAKNQILNIVLNLFFGVIVNTARGIANQVNSAVTSFSSNFCTAIRPQIIKNYAAKQKDNCLKLVFRGCKMTFFLMWIFTLPLCIEMPIVLKIWLKNPPEYAVLFTQLALIEALIGSISNPLMTLAQATGKIKLYQGVVGGILLLNLPVSYVFLKLGCQAYSVFVVSIGITALATIVRLLIIKLLTEFSVKTFFTKVILNCTAIVIVSCILPLLINHFVKNEIANFFSVVFVSVLSVGLCVMYIGLNKEERGVVFGKVRSLLGYIGSK